MNSMLMRGWQTAIVIVATFFVAAALWPWSPLSRLVCATVAGVLILVVLVLRIRDHASALGGGGRSSIEDTQSRIDRIRADRERRFGRH